MTTCDLPDCEEIYAGDERPDDWINVALKSNDVEGTKRLVFCSYTDLSIFANFEAQAREDAGGPDGD